MKPEKTISRLATVALVLGLICMWAATARPKPPAGKGGGSDVLANPALLHIQAWRHSIYALSAAGEQAVWLRGDGKDRFGPPRWSPDLDADTEGYQGLVAVHRTLITGNQTHAKRQYQICTVLPDGTGLEVVCEGIAPSSGPAWTPDGTRLLFVKYGLWSLTLDPDGVLVEPERLDDDPENPWGQQISVPEFSPDLDDVAAGYQGKMAYVEHGIIHLMDVSIAEPGAAINFDLDSVVELASGGAPRWSPDGGSLVYTTGSGGKSVWLVDMTKEPLSPTLLFKDAAAFVVVDATWSPDGKWIAFVGQGVPQQGTWGSDVYRIRPDGTDVTRMTEARKRHLRLDWNPGWTNDVDN